MVKCKYQKKGQVMSLEEMVSLIQQEWSDSMSDDGRIWQKTFEKLMSAKKKYPALYISALDIAKDRVNQ